MATIIDAIAARVGRSVSSRGLRMPCPAHGGDGLNLLVSDGKDGRLRVHCFSAGCERDAILAALERLTGLKLTENNDVVQMRSPVIAPEIADRVQRDARKRERRSMEVSFEAKRLVRTPEFIERKMSDSELAGLGAKRAMARKTGESTGDRYYDVHPYLVAKGFPNERTLLHEGKILLPMFHPSNPKQITSWQTIDENGVKQFPWGGRVKGSCYTLSPPDGVPSTIALVEGYATGLSVRDALKSIYQRPLVAVCFSGGNLKPVAQSYNRSASRVIIIADNDASGAGMRYALDAAQAIGVSNDRIWHPPYVGQDANDFALQYGIRELANALRMVVLNMAQSDLEHVGADHTLTNLSEMVM